MRYWMKNKKSGKRKKYKKLIINLIVVFFIVIFVRLFVFEIYYVSGDSMNDTLMDGDIVIINKLVYGGRIPNSIIEIPWINAFSIFFTKDKRTKLQNAIPSKKRFIRFNTIKRGEILVLNNPMNYRNFLVKRCITQPEDSLSINEDAEIFLNSRKIEEYPLVKKRYIVDYSKSEISEIYPFTKLTDSLKIPYFEDRIHKRIPKKNIYMTAQQKQLLASVIGEGIIKSNICDEIDNRKSVNKYNHYFVMGDNRCSSTDSRHFGFVPENLIIGRIDLIIFSLSKNGKLRKNRFFVHPSSRRQ
jgi:signal peptidase I